MEDGGGATTMPAGGEDAGDAADGGAMLVVVDAALALPSLPRFLLACAVMLGGVVLPLGFFLARSRAKGGAAGRQRMV